MKIVVAYSGGLDTSVLLKWLKETYQAEVIAYCADVGQGDELDGLEEKALNTGASKYFIGDLRESFAADYIFPMLQAGAIYEGRYLLGTSIARPCIAAGMLEVAQAEGADAIAHGATGKGNDQVRFELTAAALAPKIKCIAPWRDARFREQFPGRSEMIAYAEANGIPVKASMKKPYSMDRNLLHISFEAGMLEDPWFDATTPENRDMYVLSTSPEDAPDQPEYVQILFEKGNAIGLRHDDLDAIIAELGDVAPTGQQDGYTLLTPYGVMRVLNLLGGRNGVGRVDIVENRFVGMKSRGVYETPGGTILTAAHRDIEALTIDREAMHIRDSLIPKYAQLVYNGFWFAPEREAIQALVTETQKRVSGEVRVKLYKGNIMNAGRRSPFSLYSRPSPPWKAVPRRPTTRTTPPASSPSTRCASRREGSPVARGSSSPAPLSSPSHRHISQAWAAKPAPNAVSHQRAVVPGCVHRPLQREQHRRAAHVSTVAAAPPGCHPGGAAAPPRAPRSRHGRRCGRAPGRARPCGARTRPDTASAASPGTARCNWFFKRPPAFTKRIFSRCSGTCTVVKFPACQRPGSRLVRPDRRRRAVTEQAQADQHPGVVVGVERRRADLHRHRRHPRPRVRGQEPLRRAQHRDRRPAAEPDQVLQVRRIPQTELLGHVARHPRAQVTGAGAHEQRVQVAGRQTRRRRAPCTSALPASSRRLALEQLVEFLRRAAAHRVDPVDAQVARLDPGLPVAEDLAHQQPATAPSVR